MSPTHPHSNETQSQVGGCWEVGPCGRSLGQGGGASRMGSVPQSESRELLPLHHVGAAWRDSHGEPGGGSHHTADLPAPGCQTPRLQNWRKSVCGTEQPPVCGVPFQQPNLILGSPPARHPGFPGDQTWRKPRVRVWDSHNGDTRVTGLEDAAAYPRP